MELRNVYFSYNPVLTEVIHVVLLRRGRFDLLSIYHSYTEITLILSGDAIMQYIKYGGLKFEPALEPDQFQQNGVDMIVESVEQDLLAHGGFTLGVTRETITMPNDLMAFVQMRSTWARKGFIVPPTVIDAGFHGTITLEIAKFGAPERVPVGQRFAHIIFAKMCTPSEPYNGKYQGQTGITHAK